MDYPIQLLTEIDNGKPVKIVLPLKGSSDTLRINCLYGKKTPPDFTLFFPEHLPVQTMDSDAECTVIIDMAGTNVSLQAQIQEIRNGQALILRALNVISHEQLRNYFRVDLTAPVTAIPLVAPEQNPIDKLTITGETIDISGGGLLASFSESLPPKQPLQVKFILPSADAHIIQAMGHVVRTVKIAENNYQIALHFDQISSEDRDKIIRCCFEVQRQQLRLKVQVKEHF
ncbi:MAG: PilZ domain-containing protein [Desulfobulbaceae bacterium]|nr:PilZ domain-containing protein [Desulfobulbaceae bacterium]